jgi:hypothetical protein
MLKLTKYILILAIVTFTLSGCGANSQIEENDSLQTTLNTTTSTENSNTTTENTATEKTAPEVAKPLSDSDLAKFKPNESGKVMVVMFHNFIEAYKSGDKTYSNTFDAFRTLLQTLYDKGYRLINVNDYLDNNIQVAAGCIPMMFTFDDGTVGQFNLVEENGKLIANKQSAVGIMEEFNKLHPDFGLKGTFYVNLGGSTFTGEGTVAERLQYLIDKGFEIGNHTLNHIDLKTEAKTAEKIQEEVGGNQKKMEEYVPGYKMRSLALPLGNSPNNEALRQYVVRGEYQGQSYQNSAIMLVGAEPALPVTSSKFDPLLTRRVRASGILKEDTDLDWWLDGHISIEQQYISDGDPNTITVPKAKESLIDIAKLSSKVLKVY